MLLIPPEGSRVFLYASLRMKRDSRLRVMAITPHCGLCKVMSPPRGHCDLITSYALSLRTAATHPCVHRFHWHYWLVKLYYKHPYIKSRSLNKCHIFSLFLFLPVLRGLLEKGCKRWFFFMWQRFPVSMTTVARQRSDSRFKGRKQGQQSSVSLDLIVSPVVGGWGLISMWFNINIAVSIAH